MHAVHNNGSVSQPKGKYLPKTRKSREDRTGQIQGKRGDWARNAFCSPSRQLDRRRNVRRCGPTHSRRILKPTRMCKCDGRDWLYKISSNDANANTSCFEEKDIILGLTGPRAQNWRAQPLLRAEFWIFKYVVLPSLGMSCPTVHG